MKISDHGSRLPEW